VSRPTTTTEIGPDPAIYFLSDYGTVDEFVGVVHAVLHRVAPTVRVIDLSHQVPPFDVAAGAAMLVRCGPYLGAGVVLAVVDPGVGTTRRAVALQVGPAGPAWLVGPDNGLLLPLAAMLGGVQSAIGLDRRQTASARTSQSFDGRDLFAPAAGHLALGGAPDDLGSSIDLSSLVSPEPVVAHDGGVAGGSTGSEMVAPVAWVDRFGNVQLQLNPTALEAIGLSLGGTARVTVVPGATSAGPPPVPRRSGTGEGSHQVRWVETFGQLARGELGLMVDGNGRMALVVNQGSAAQALGLPPVGRDVRIATDGAGTDQG